MIFFQDNGTMVASNKFKYNFEFLPTVDFDFKAEEFYYINKSNIYFAMDLKDEI